MANSENNGENYDSDISESPEGTILDPEMLQHDINSSTVEARTEGEKSTVTFRSYGILTFWMLPVFFGYILIENPGLWFWLSVILFAQALFRRKSIPVVSPLFFHLSRLTYGAKFSKNDTSIPRVWWFFTFGTLISGIIVIFMTASLFFILPLILLISRRKRALRILYFISFLPRKEYLDYNDPEYFLKRQELLSQYNKSQRQYMIFLKPQSLTYVVSYMLILVVPFVLLLLLVPINIFIANDELVRLFNSRAGDLAFVGLISIIPYIILMLPIFGKFKLNRLVSSRLGRIIVETITGSAINSLPLFDGEYFIEKESNVIDMSESTGFFAIFGNGRFVTILLTPMALISLIFRDIVIGVTGDRGENSVTAKTFFEGFFGNIDILFGFLLFIIPVVITIILPLILVLSDSEIKRSNWKSTTFMSTHKEISSVEDVGTTINNLFKIVLGVGTITSLSNSIRFLLVQTSALDGYIITAVLLIFGAILVLPGTLFMVYHHFSSGDHYLSVNYLRYLLSQSDNIAVGTIDRVYDKNIKLEDPPQEVLNLIRLNN